jgi:flagellin-like protein
MRYRPRWRRRRQRRGVAEIIGVILLVALTVTAGAILWTFRIYLPPAPPHAGFDIRSGGSNPVWGDPTDCQPSGNWTYPLAASKDTEWGDGWWDQCEFFSEDEYPTPGNFSSMNTTEIIFDQLSSSTLPLTDINFTFVCNGNYAPSPYTENENTILVTGSLATMTWFPGVEGEAPADAPYLGYCGGFDMGDEAGVAFGSLFTRLGIFEPLSATNPDLENGDTFIVYIHNGGYPLDYACVEGGPDDAQPPGQPWYDDDLICPSGITGGPLLDVDDYHGTPPWCFSSELACTIYLTYTGSPSTLLAKIPVYSLAPPAG